jgi:hypothetical protein
LVSLNHLTVPMVINIPTALEHDAIDQHSGRPKSSYGNKDPVFAADALHGQRTLDDRMGRAHAVHALIRESSKMGEMQNARPVVARRPNIWPQIDP